MPRHSWDFDDEADEWSKKYSLQKKIKETYPVELASGYRHVVLDSKEWNLLQRFLSNHSKNTTKRSDYDHLPAKVRLVIYDWIKN